MTHKKKYRDGELHNLRWLSRKVGNEGDGGNQQYVYILEANIVFKNGLTIPLLTEYLKTEWNVLINPEGKQDCELVAFNRLAAKLKKIFSSIENHFFCRCIICYAIDIRSTERLPMAIRHSVFKK